MVDQNLASTHDLSAFEATVRHQTILSRAFEMLNNAERGIAYFSSRRESASPAVSQVCHRYPSLGRVPVIGPRIERDAMRLGHSPPATNTLHYPDIVLDRAPHFGLALISL
jgi:hypothetical protein